METDISSQLRICIDKVVKKVSRETLSRATRASNVLRNAEWNVLSGQRSGKVYRKPHSKATYTASAPGEPPARRTGNLRMSFASYTEASKSGKDYTVIAGIKSNVNYAGILENGSRRMARRPYKEPIIDKAKQDIERIFSEPYNL